MDECIRNGVASTEPHLPGGLKVKRRAPGLYRRLQKGFYLSVELREDMNQIESSARDHPNSVGLTEDGSGSMIPARRKNMRLGRKDHPVRVIPKRTTPVFPGIEYLSCMAIAVSRRLPRFER